MGYLCRRASVGTHLDTGQVFTDGETAIDVLRDIFPIPSPCDETLCTLYNESIIRPCSSKEFHKAGSVSLGLDTSPSLSFLVESYARARTLPQGMALHHHIVSFGLERSPYLCDLLAWMYGRCGFHNDAFYCFNNMGDRSITMWSFMIGLHVEYRSKGGMAIQLFQQSLNCNVFPDTSTMTHLLSCCACKEDLVRGKQMHVLIKGIGYERDVVVGTALVSMYSRCNNFQEARISFYEIPEKNVVSWSAMIAACVQHDSGTEAIWLFKQMQQEGLLPNIVTFVSAVSACARERNNLVGKSLHIQVPNDGPELNVALAAALVNMYGKWGSVENACMIFQDVNEPCVILWTGMLTAYSQHGYAKEANQAFSQMLEHGILPNEVTYLCMISFCESNEVLPAGKRIHAQLLSSGIMSNPVMSTAITLMYGKCGSMVDSHQIFNSSEEKCIVAWDAMISLCVNKGQIYEGIQLFSHMQQRGLSPDKFTFVNVLQACACVLAAFEGKKVHHYVLQTEFRSDIFVCNALIDMYSKCNLLDVAQLVFNGMHERDTVSWNLLITWYTQSGYGEKALVLFHQMQVEKIVPDHFTFASILSALAQRANLCECWRMHSLIIQKGFDLELVVATKLINMYSKSGSFKAAQLVFDRMHERDDTLWSAFLTAHDQLDTLQAIQLFDQIKSEGFFPSITILTKGLSVCTSHGALTKIKQLHISILHSDVESNSECMQFFVHMYSECGDLNKAEEIFHLFYKRDLKLWNFMIAGLARHGQGTQAIEFFKEMQQWGAMPDDVTFVYLLSACSHCGLVDEAFSFLMSMIGQAAVIHYDCVIDLLGRVGQLNQAAVFIENMPFQPTAVTWTSLLGACSIMLDEQGGKCAADHLVEVREEGFVPYILLSVLDARLNQIYGQ